MTNDQVTEKILCVKNQYIYLSFGGRSDPTISKGPPFAIRGSILSNGVTPNSFESLGLSVTWAKILTISSGDVFGQNTSM